MNPLERFSDRATAYAKYRPSYPKEAIATLLAGLGNPSQLVAADKGEAQQQLVLGLKQIYERDRDRDEHGLVYLAYHTSVYLAQPEVRSET